LCGRNSHSMIKINRIFVLFIRFVGNVTNTWRPLMDLFKEMLKEALEVFPLLPLAAQIIFGLCILALMLGFIALIILITLIPTSVNGIVALAGAAALVFGRSNKTKQ